MVVEGKVMGKLAVGVMLSLLAIQGNGYAEDSSSTANGVEAFSLETMTVEAKRPDWESKLSPGTVTIIRPDDYKGEQKTLPELLKQVPGVHVRELNGKGQYTTVTLRGSTAAQVGVFVDGVLFNLGGDAAADISTIPVQNVERIEVYRGYIPARFGGTYLGGVINVVTKRPGSAKVVTSIGKSSYGGYRANLQIDAPLGTGSLMVGVNHEQSDGDFKYYFKPQSTLEALHDSLLKNYTDTIQYAVNSVNNGLAEIDLRDANGQLIQVANKEQWESVYNQYGETIKDDIRGKLDFSWMFPSVSGYAAFMDTSVNGQTAIYNDMKNMGMDVGSDLNDLLSRYNVSSIQEVLAKQNNLSSPEEYAMGFVTSYEQSQLLGGALGSMNSAEEYKKRAEAIKSNWRYRKANDYKNTDVLIKWQDEHWLAKTTWKKIKRHMPFPYNWNYGSLEFVDVPPYADNPLEIYYHRNQELTAKEYMLGRRDTVGNLEWGWNISYLDQDKDYYVDNWQWILANVGSAQNAWSPNTMWSNYDMHRWNGQIDGSYKAGDRHLIEFLVNGSKEKMDIKGWKMDSNDFHSIDTRKRWRNYYEQKLFNVQLQDTITLNTAKDFWLTPSVRYNRSNILGSSRWYDSKDDPQNIKWLNQTDDQTDSKVTWQLALKKELNKSFTLRATGGTYFRLLNMYEIAGDGAGILPMPNVGGSASVFPRPEEGKQWDLSAIWEGKVLGAESARLQLTYFGRDAEKILQLGSWNNFFFVYNNAGSGKVNGAEIQADVSWKKWDVNLQATYTQPTDIVYDNSALPGAGYWGNNGVFKGLMTYQPKWEGAGRITYRPDKNWSLFTQLRYIDEMYTSIYG